ncbi:helix-turn-helix domain-containing protein [Allofournierella sp.]|uniref:helix-turn-helix domain-containing protein n=1 Tax=Allofournierella sp. TaxID=1940256 RepID=UPI003AB2A564
MITKSSLAHISQTRTILIREENFAYLLPCEELRNTISNFTITFPNKAIISDAYTVMPHGSATLVFFVYNTQLHGFLFGPTTKPVKVGDIANKCGMIFIIEFQPAGFSPFKKTNQKELTNKIVPFSAVDYSLDTALKNILRGSSSVDELLLRAEEKFLQSMLFQYPTELSRAVTAIIQSGGLITSAELSQKSFYCPRHLNRLFDLYIGMGMKSFSRLVRVNRSLHFLNQRVNTLGGISEKLGYYDVSHFVKDFKIVCNITPQEYRANMSDFYSEIAKF